MWENIHTHALRMSTEQTEAAIKGKYRPELDGLRAFAVVAVIFNHFNKDVLPGGYLGVDIFFCDIWVRHHFVPIR